MEIQNMRVSDLVDGDLFSLDGGFTWYFCAVRGFGTVSAYATHERGDAAPTLRVTAEPGRVVLALVEAAFDGPIDPDADADVDADAERDRRLDVEFGIV